MCNLRAKKHMTVQEKKAMMHNIVEQWHDSGLSQAAFAKTNNIPLSTLSYRLKKFRKNQNQDFIQLTLKHKPCLLVANQSKPVS